MTPAPTTPPPPSKPKPEVDARCHCRRCTDPRTYELPGSCINCGLSATIVYRFGDKAVATQCPNCGNRRMEPKR